MDLMNLAQETKEKLAYVKISEVEVLYVTDGKSFCTWTEFLVQAEQINYDDGFGSQEINEDLKVVGKDWWLERYEYDGSEGWSLRRHQVQPVMHSPVLQIVKIWSYD